MANRLFAWVLLVVLLLTPSFSSARLLNDDFNTVLVLPGRVLPCHHHAEAAGRIGASPAKRVVAGKYGPLVLNMLPKGTVPPSGPSKGTNNVNN
ncbi:hypothetical protein G2W53_013206 [Senna tora]|uniref:Uncharacterized protein n=1 Tax=Senna tora TaxID=362788 RepID=A0A834TYG1_9FABA|nr:hypothetical protein G2W53_013206 [Senna tora]